MQKSRPFCQLMHQMKRCVKPLLVWMTNCLNCPKRLCKYILGTSLTLSFSLHKKMELIFLRCWTPVFIQRGDGWAHIGSPCKSIDYLGIIESCPLKACQFKKATALGIQYFHVLQMFYILKFDALFFTLQMGHSYNCLNWLADRSQLT